jgi:uncharacterized membrane protein
VSSDRIALRRTGTAETREPRDRRSPSVAAALLPGIGLGGFVDGIVLHQILQWHHMLTATDGYLATTVKGPRDNTLADGLFRASTWVFVAVGMALLVRARQHGDLAPPSRFNVGWLLAGWGTFNVIEGLVDHHLLTVHHVRDDVEDPLCGVSASSPSGRRRSSCSGGCSPPLPGGLVAGEDLTRRGTDPLPLRA